MADEVAWSPDESRIAYRADQEADGVFELYTVRTNAGENLKVNPVFAPPSAANDGVTVAEVRWSRDSSRLAFVTAEYLTIRDPLFGDDLVLTRRTEQVAAPNGSAVAELRNNPDGKTVWSH